MLCGFGCSKSTKCNSISSVCLDESEIEMCLNYVGFLLNLVKWVFFALVKWVKQEKVGRYKSLRGKVSFFWVKIIPYSPAGKRNKPRTVPNYHINETALSGAFLCVQRSRTCTCTHGTAGLNLLLQD